MAGLLQGMGTTPPIVPPTHGVRHAPTGTSPISPGTPSILSGGVNPMTMMGLSLLAGNRPSRNPTNPWASMAQGLQASQQMTGDAQDRALRQQMYDLQMQKMSQPEAPETKVVNGSLVERQPDGSWKEVVAAQEKGDPPKIRERMEGTTVIQEEWDPKKLKWTEIGRGPKWQPESTRADAPYYEYADTGRGIVKLDKRGREAPVYILDESGRPIVRSTSDPSLRGDIASAEAKGSAEGKREYGMEGIGEIIQQADDILAGKGGAKPTASGIGAAVDTVAGLVGADPEGAAEAAKLKAIGGALTAKMPRMEGPQSDKDTLMYREMAGQIGDATIPIARRRAALEVVKSIWAKYEQGASVPSDNLQMVPGAPLSVEDRLKKYGIQ